MPELANAGLGVLGEYLPKICDIFTDAVEDNNINITSIQISVSKFESIILDVAVK